MHTLLLVNRLGVIVPANPRKNRASPELLYKSNRPQVLYGLEADKPLGMLVEHLRNS